MNRLKIAQYIALGATISSVVGYLIFQIAGAKIGGYLVCLGFFAGLVSYIFGGFGTAFKMAVGIANKWDPSS